MTFDASKSLQELENKDWGEPNYPSSLVRRCHKLRCVPLENLSAEDCRLLLGQNIGAPFVVPIALKFLHQNPLEGGDMSLGVLIRSVLRLEAPFWEKHPELWWEVKEIVFEVEFMRKTIEELAPAIRDFEAFQNLVMGKSSKMKKVESAMLVFFDESGDTGFKIGSGSSQLFTVTMVVFEDHEDAQATDERIALLRRELGKKSGYEFHFAENSDAIRRAFFEAVARYNFFFFSFVIDKSRLRAHDWPSAEAFYSYVCALVFEAAKPYLDNAIVRLDESGGRSFRAQIGTDLKRRMNRESGRNYIKKVVFSKSSSNNLLQLADMICGAVARAQGERSDKADFYELIRHREIWVRRWPEK